MSGFFLFLSVLPEGTPSWFLWAVPLLVGVVLGGGVLLAAAFFRADKKKETSSEHTEEPL